MDSKISRPVSWTPQEEATGGRLIDRLDGILHPAEKLLAFISALCIFALMLIGVANISGRTIFNFSMFGYIDMVELSISIFAFLAIAYCERNGLAYRVEEPKAPKRRIVAYSDNFKHNRVGAWTH